MTTKQLKPFLGLFFILMLFLAGCASESSDQKSIEEAANDAAVQENLLPDTVIFDASKIIRRGNIRLYTDDFNKARGLILKTVETYDGFLQDSQAYYSDDGQGTYGTFVLRIPTGDFQAAMKDLEEAGTLASSSQSAENITSSYQDTESQLESLRIQEAQLKSYLQSAKDVKDLLAIEVELNRIRTEIDHRLSLLKNWDKELAYSTIGVYVEENALAASVVDSPFGSLPGEIRDGFIGSLNALLALISWLIVLVFRLLPFTIPVAAGIFVWHKAKGMKHKNREAMEDKKTGEGSEKG